MLSIDSGFSPLPFCLNSDKLEWINQFLFRKYFSLAVQKNKQTKVESDIKLVRSHVRYYESQLLAQLIPTSYFQAMLKLYFHMGNW